MSTNAPAAPTNGGNISLADAAQDYDWGTSPINSMSREQEPEMELGNFGDVASNPAESPETNSETPSEVPGQEPNAQDIEEILVQSEFGKQKIKVNYSDREAIKRAHQEAAGMRKFAAERDKLVKSQKELQEKVSTIEPLWNKLDEAYQRQGPEAVLDMLTGQKGYVEQLIQERMAREGMRVKAPHEADRLDRLEQDARERREREYEKAQQQKLTQSYEDKLARAEEKEAYAMLSPSFERHSVSGKLGDPMAESRINKAVWNDVMDVLAEMDDSLVNQATVDREFRKAFAVYTRGVQSQAKKELTKVTADAKTNAKQQIASRAQASMQSNNESSNWESDYMSGKITGASLLQKMLGKK